MEENGQKTQNGDALNEPATRELTQTDHLNKSLLNSFLERLNQPGSGFPVVERIRTEEPEVSEPANTEQQIAESNSSTSSSSSSGSESETPGH
jgi:hypothetical protein